MMLSSEGAPQQNEPENAAKMQTISVEGEDANDVQDEVVRVPTSSGNEQQHQKVCSPRASIENEKDHYKLIPTEFSKLSNLQDLQLTRNEISGPLPSEFGRLSSLRRIDLSYNAMTGQLPTEIGLWQIELIHLDYNNFTSTIPSEIGFIPNLQTLVLAGSGFYGTIPSHIFRPGSVLTTFDAAFNSLQGTIPTQTGQVVNLQMWSAAANRLTGTIPTEYGFCTDLSDLDFSRNRLTRTLPSELGSLSNLAVLAVDQNDLTGTVPVQICQVTAPVSCIPTLQCLACACICTLSGGSQL